MGEGAIDPMLVHSQGSCSQRPWLHRLCRWLVPAAFVAGALAVLLTASTWVGLAVVGVVLLLCPVVCVVLLLWQGRRSEQAISDAVGRGAWPQSSEQGTRDRSQAR